MAKEENKKTLRILLFGANGQVGTELFLQLKPFAEVIPCVKEGMDFFNPLALDLSQPGAATQVLEQTKPDLVVNAAAYTAVDKAETDADLALRLNAGVPQEIAEFCATHNVPVIHYSTDYVYESNSGSSPLTELSRTNPANTYGVTKLRGDEAIAQSGCPHLILRVSWVYGVFGHNFVKTMLKLGREKTNLSIVDDQIGAPTSATFIASITANLIAQLTNQPDFPNAMKKYSGVYHLCPQGFTSWHNFAKNIFATAKTYQWQTVLRELAPIPTSGYPTPAKRPLNSRLNTEKIRKTFNLHLPTWQEVWELEAMKIFNQLY